LDKLRLMAGMPERSEWQRRYDESVARERAALKQADDVSGTELATQMGGCLPGGVGAGVLAPAGVVAFIRRRRRHPGRSQR